MHFLLAVATLSVLLTQSASRAPIVQSVDLSVPFAPVTFTQDGRTQLVYELHVTNFQRTDVTLTAVRIDAPNAVLAEFKDEDLHQRIVRPGLRNDHATPQLVGPGMRAVVNLWIPLTDLLVPASVINVVQVEAGSTRAVVQATVPIRRPQPPLVLDAPLGSGQWVALYDPTLKGGHRTAIYTVDGRARIPGRFAIDFILLPSGMMALNPGIPLQQRNGFGSDVLAVADGTIATAVDDTPDDLPQPVPPERASGNYVSLDLGGGRFAFYEHLQQGSIRVKAGERVKRGQVVARLGASGSTSSGPHLHFHVADANSLLGAEGLPFVFRRYTRFGAFASIFAPAKGEKWLPEQSARLEADARPAPNTVISFP